MIKPEDTYFIIEEGEFEDILKHELICRAVNNFYKAERHITMEEIEQLLNDFFKEEEDLCQQQQK